MYVPWRSSTIALSLMSAKLGLSVKKTKALPRIPTHALKRTHHKKFVRSETNTSMLKLYSVLSGRFVTQWLKNLIKQTTLVVKKSQVLRYANLKTSFTTLKLLPVTNGQLVTRNSQTLTNRRICALIKSHRRRFATPKVFSLTRHLSSAQSSYNVTTTKS